MKRIMLQTMTKTSEQRKHNLNLKKFVAALETSHSRTKNKGI